MMLPKFTSFAITFVLSMLHEDIGILCDHHPYSTLVRSQHPYFVDKTELLKEIFAEPQPYLYITCPRYFGKTTNLDMIEHFAQIELDDDGNVKPWNETEAFDVFSKLKIAVKDKNDDSFITHLAQHPIIRIDLRIDTIHNQTLETLKSHVRNRLKDAFERYRWLLSNDTSESSSRRLSKEHVILMQNALNGRDIEQSFQSLPSILYEYFDHLKVIILVDNFDSVAVHSVSKRHFRIAEFYQWLRELLNYGEDADRDYQHIQCALITGTSAFGFYLPKWRSSDPIWHHPFLESDLKGFCGFLEHEVDSIFDRYHCSKNEISGIKTYYGGYRTPDGKDIYDPYSFTRYFQSSSDRRLRSYWPIGDRCESTVEKFLNFYDIYDLLNKSIDDRRTNVSIWGRYDSNAIQVFELLRDLDYQQYFKNKEYCLQISYTFALENGYLSRMDKGWYVSPNSQTRQVVAQLIAQYVEKRGGLPSEHLPLVNSTSLWSTQIHSSSTECSSRSS